MAEKWISVEELAKQVLNSQQDNSSPQNSSLGGGQYVSDYNDTEYFDNEISKQDGKISELQNQSKTYLTGNPATDSIITTPQSNWTYEQQTIAQINPDLKQLNAGYLNNVSKIQNLQNEKVSLEEAKQMMQKAYQDAINATNKSADTMMAANMANANIQAGGAISSSRGLATNPAAAAATRMSAQNQAAIQNATVRSQADQNLANIYGNMANMPSVLSSIAANNTNSDIARLQAEGQALSNYKDLTSTSNGGYSYSGGSGSNGGGSGSNGGGGGDGGDNFTYRSVDEYLNGYDKLTDNQKKYYNKLVQQFAKDNGLGDVKRGTKDFDAALTLLKSNISNGNYVVEINKDGEATFKKKTKDKKDTSDTKEDNEETKENKDTKDTKEDKDVKVATGTSLSL